MADRARLESTLDSKLVTGVSIVARGGTPEADLAALLELAVDAVGGERGSVFVWDVERGGLAMAGSFGFAAGAAGILEAAVAGDSEHPIARTAHGRAGNVATEGVAPDGTQRTGATWPLRVAHDGVEEPIGVLAISRAGAWTMKGHETALLAAFADLIAITVDRARLTATANERTDWSERMSHTDALTGLANARTLSRVLELEVARASRHRTDLSVALFDVDGLAGANAAGGPAMGDDILREVAAILAESIRLVDTIGRWGGDEFLLVAPGAAGMTVARRVLEAVTARPAVDGRRISVSAGVARFPADGASADELLAAAQAALQTAKGSGPGALAEAGAA